VRELRSRCIVSEARCLCLFEAEDAAAVAALNEAARLPLTRSWYRARSSVLRTGQHAADHGQLKMTLDNCSFSCDYIRIRYIRGRHSFARKGSTGMANSLQRPEELLPLTPAVFNILLALADGEKHGYGIMLEVEATTNGQVLMGPGTLYGSIKRMLAAGLIEESDERVDPEMDDPRRRSYYRLTDLGRRTLRMEAERLASQVQIAKAKNVLAIEFSGGAA